MADILGFAQNLQMDKKIGGILDDFQKQQLMKRQLAAQEQEQALRAETQGLQNQQSRMSLANLQRQMGEDEAARQAVIARRTPQMVANPEYRSLAQLRDVATAGPPSLSPETSMLEYPGQEFGADTFQQQPEMIQRQVPSASQALYEHYLEKGNVAKAEEIRQSALKTSKELSEQFGPEVGAQYLFNVTGEKYEPKPQIKQMAVGGQLVEVDMSPSAQNLPLEQRIKTYAVEKEKPEYKSRERISGDKTIFEESIDGGKTWKKVSEGPRYKPTSGGGKASEQKDFKNEMSMRKEFQSLPEVKDFPVIESNTKRAIAALKAQGKSNVAVDQTIITVFNKMLDPTSVVRESEYARTPQDLSILSRIKGKWDKIQRGGAGLDSSEREALARMVSNFAEIAGQQYNDQVQYFTDLANRYGYKPENIVRLGGKKFEATAPASPTSPATKVGGFTVRVKGGQ